MKWVVRSLAILAVLLVVVLAGVLAVAFHPETQKSVVVWAINQSPEVQSAQLDSARIGPGSIRVTDVNLEAAFGSFAVEEVDVSISLLKLFTSKEIHIPSLKVVGLRADLSQLETTPTEATVETTRSFAPGSPATTEEASRPPPQKPWNWRIFPEQAIPPIIVEEIALDAEVLLPEQRSVRVEGSGDGIEPGRNGSLVLAVAFDDATEGAELARASGEVQLSIEQRGAGGLSALQMITRLELAGASFPSQVSLRSDLQVRQDGDTETMELTLTRSSAGTSSQLAQVEVVSRPGTQTASGSYQLNLSGTDLAAFLGEESWEGFLATGTGNFAIAESAGQVVLSENITGDLTIRSPGEGRETLEVSYAASYEPDSQRATVNLPVRLRGASGTSDLDIEVVQALGSTEPIQAILTGQRLALADFQAFAAGFAVTPEDQPAPEEEEPAPAPATVVLPEPVRDTMPFWGQQPVDVTVDLKSILLPNGTETLNVRARVEVRPDRLDVPEVAGTIDNATFAASSAIAFSPDAEEPYNLDTTASIESFDIASVVRPAPNAPAPISGFFDGRLNASGLGKNAAHLAENVQGRVEARSQGGVLRLLDAGMELDTPIPVGGAGALLGLIGGAAQVNELELLSRLIAELKSLNYDRLDLVLQRDESLDLTVEELNVVSDIIRLQAPGVIDYQEGVEPDRYPLDLDLTMAFRGSLVDIFGRADFRLAPPDANGYAALPTTVEVVGTVGEPASPQLEALINRLQRNLVQKLLRR